MRPSVTKLTPMLKAFGAVTETFGASRLVACDKDYNRKLPMGAGFGMSNETYGKDSQVYIGCPDAATRIRLERFLSRNGVTTVDPLYSPKGNTVEVGVGYFKGYHWDE